MKADADQANNPIAPDSALYAGISPLRGRSRGTDRQAEGHDAALGQSTCNTTLSLAARLPLLSMAQCSQQQFKDLVSRRSPARVRMPDCGHSRNPSDDDEPRDLTAKQQERQPGPGKHRHPLHLAASEVGSSELPRSRSSSPPEAREGYSLAFVRVSHPQRLAASVTCRCIR